MKNEILEKVINDVVNNTSESEEFKSAMKAYIKNKFDGNADDNDLNTVLSLIQEDGGDSDVNDNN